MQNDINTWQPGVSLTSATTNRSVYLVPHTHVARNYQFANCPGTSMGRLGAPILALFLEGVSSNLNDMAALFAIHTDKLTFWPSTFKVPI